jgi:UDP-GlcNAc:undecaprenyl-phosphate GlcNAc-1-phosphate transferase
MQYSFWQYFLLSFATFVYVGLLTPLMRRIAISINAVDKPNSERKTQKTPVPYLGGVSIALGVIFASYFALAYSEVTKSNLASASSVLLPAALLGAMGLIDDLKGLSPWPRLIAQSLTGIIVSIVLIATKTIGTPTGKLLIDFAINTIWIVGLSNSINFFDNIDGGASGTVLFSSIFIFIIAYLSGQIMVSALSIVVVGATAGFLIWNKPPAKIYMGDAGALFLGVVVGVLTIKLDPNVKPDLLSLCIPFFLLAVPILDTSVAVLSRISRKLSPFTPGRDHLSHRLMRTGFDRKKAVFALWALSTFFGAISLLIYKTQIAGLALIAFTSWMFLFRYFYRIPHND